MEIRYIEYGTKEYDENVELRIEVLRRPHKCGMDEEERQFEKEGAPILGLYEKGKMIGSGVMACIDKDQIEVRYMAVREGYRGKGAGNFLMDEMEDYGRKNNYKKVFLVSRTSALPFYEKRGYKKIGEAYEPDFVPVMHIHMEKKL